MQLIIEEDEGELKVSLHHVLAHYDGRFVGRSRVVNTVLLWIYFFGEPDVLGLFHEIPEVLQQRSLVVEPLYVGLEALE